MNWKALQLNIHTVVLQRKEGAFLVHSLVLSKRKERHCRVKKEESSKRRRESKKTRGEDPQ